MKNRNLIIAGIVISGLFVSIFAIKILRKYKLAEEDPELEALLKKIDNAKK